MEFYLAPMEGITGYIYRTAHEKYFGTVDKYFSPFIAPNQNRCMNTREIQDVLPEHNQNMNLVPQILTNKSADFIRTCEKLEELGYKEVNLNLGCPSGTVVAKKRGSGFLGDLGLLEEFFDTVFKMVNVKVSVKTRIGIEDAAEFERLIPLYNRYPISELIVHPRVQKDFYKNQPNLEMFAQAVQRCNMPVCYNGDIFTARHYQEFVEQFPTIDRIMVGRGVLVNPNLIGNIKDGRTLDKVTLKAFHDQLREEYGKVLSGDRNLLFKMKELWFYLHHCFTEPEKYYKKIKKAEKLSAYEVAVSALFREQEIREP